jgi:RNA recognition motif-containing protein
VKEERQVHRVSKRIQNREKTMLIYVGNLSTNVSEDNFHRTFEAFGQVSFVIISSTILKDRYSGQSRRFAFVEMPDYAEARAAINNLNRKDFLGQQINVYEVNPINERERRGWQGSHRGRQGYGGVRYHY